MNDKGSWPYLLLGFLRALTILFIGLKLTGYIGWSWLWVLAPLWVPPALVLVLFVAMAIAKLVDKAMGDGK